MEIYYSSSSSTIETNLTEYHALAAISYDYTEFKHLDNGMKMFHLWATIFSISGSFVSDDIPATFWQRNMGFDMNMPAVKRRFALCYIDL